jgi:enterochelin esterase family protein
MSKVLKNAVNPIVEGKQATFIWIGEQAPVLHGDMNWWGLDHPPITLQKQDRDVWSVTLTLPEDAYMEYAFFTDGKDGETRLLDPRNPRQIGNGMGKYNNFFTMPKHKPAPERETRPTVRKGRVTKHTLKSNYIGGGKRDVWLYQPPVDEPVPLLLVWDGHDYVFRAKLPTILDNLIAQQDIAPVALLCIQNAKSYRYTEYLTGDAAIFMATQLGLPLAQAHLNLLPPENGAYGVLGASMGGLMALYTGLRLPNIFGHVISQSGAFHLKLTPDTPTLVETLFQYSQPPLQIWQDVGVYEWLYPHNQAFHRQLTNAGYQVGYREFNGGHNYTAWANQLPDALRHVFGITYVPHEGEDIPF